MLTMGQDIAADRAGAIEEAERRIVTARGRYVTLIPGQEGTYVEKKAQALDWIAQEAAGEPTIADAAAFRFILKEVGSTAETPGQVAQVIANLAYFWGIVGPDIEAARVRANGAVRAAATRADIAAALAALDAELAALPAAGG